jgi:hypothetical protein
MRYRKGLTLVILVLVVALPQLTSSAQTTGTVSGTVLYNEAPLAGVEVWVGEIDSGVSHYACTDASGNFSISDVALNTPLISATGIEVYLADPCSNPLFLDLACGARGCPLLTQYWNHHSGVGPPDQFRLTSPSRTLSYDVQRWPLVDGLPLLNNKLVSSIRQFHSGRTSLAIWSARQFLAQVDRLERRGAISTADADLLRDYTDHLINDVYGLRP